MASTKLEGVGIALCGGGFRSYSEVAVLEDMRRNDVPIAAAAGTSMGSMVATLVAGGLAPEDVAGLLVDMDDEIVEDAVIGSNISLRGAINMLNEGGLIPSATTEEYVRHTLDLAGLHTMADLAMPLAIAACDVNSGELVVLTNDEALFGDDTGGWVTIAGDDLDLAKCVCASASYPLVLAPTEYLGRTFIDGGVRMNLPCPLFNRSMVDAVVGVGMMRDMAPLDSLGPRSIALRTLACGTNQLDRISIRSADIYVNLPVSGDDAFQAGSGRQVIEEARRMVAEQPIDWSPARPGTFEAARRALVSSVSEMFRGSAG